MPEKTQNQSRGHAEALFSICQGCQDAVQHHLVGDAALGVVLGIKKDFCMAYPVLVGAVEIRRS